jgi:hypothetical protein
MPSTLKDYSVSDLEQMLKSRKSELDSLIKKREKTLKELNLIEKRIKVLKGRKQADGRTKRRKSRRRVKNAQSLRSTVTEVLSRNKNGIALDPLSKRILTTGYKSNSGNFKNVLYQCLYNHEEFTHDKKTGLYRVNSNSSKNGSTK